ncbi:MAG: phosphoribosylformylglycinamidine cyclo-ligase [Candidatus Obscuribacterales bacterium]|nr:phosphoribosylformylglycinamidine cyclo-ligase [Candidatus Obscuribacterales bacterium]
MTKETYASSGVQIDKAELFVERLKSNARRQAHAGMWKSAGGYAAVQPLTADLGVAVTTDGVGTKVLVADELKKFDTVGIDLVAMVANDLICVGATPNMFLDYFAVGRLDDSLADDIISGIIEGCDRADMYLAGGETAELPGLYQDGHYDLAGFAVGSVKKADLLSGDEIKAGQKLIAVASSGIHSNGLSLARKVLPKEKWQMLLEPTAIYVKAALSAFAEMPGAIKGLAHITGGGWRNLLRLNEKVGFNLEKPLPLPEVFTLIQNHVEEEEMYKTFNMGMGLGIIAEEKDSAQIIDCFKSFGHNAALVGSVTSEAGLVRIAQKSFVLKNKHS